MKEKDEFIAAVNVLSVSGIVFGFIGLVLWLFDLIQ